VETSPRPAYDRVIVRTVSSFAAVGGSPYRYTFLLVVCNTYTDSVRTELNQQAEAFAADLHGQGELAQSFPSRIYDTAREVLAKPWPSDLVERMEDDPEPFVVVIDQPFGEFDPREHPYAVIWLSDFQADPGSVRPMLQALARKTRSKEKDDVILYLRDIAKDERDGEHRDQAASAVSTAARLASYVEIKPSVFGVSVDLKAVLRDIAQRQRQ
jgi:hypothetical protein